MINIPDASEVRAAVSQKITIKNATDGTANPEVNRSNLLIVIEAIDDRLQRAKNDPLFVGNSITIAIDSPFLGRAFFTKITDYLTAKGYTPTPNVGAGTLTISW